ncbi:MAG: class I SAM-dependent methyltransferase, partial [Saprospiraceae bacterium]
LYDMDKFMAGETSLNSIELHGLGDVKDLSLLHLQCHFGQDTLSWARLGAKVTGVDISPEAIKKADELKAALNLQADFICTDVYSFPEQNRQLFDIVFTSYGCIVWLPDLDIWAKVINSALKSGGTFYMADFHPTFMLFNFDNCQIEYDYFNKGVIEEISSKTYTGQELQQPVQEFFWQHSLSEIFTALIDNGLEIVDFQEFDYSPYACFPNMSPIGPKQYRFDAVKVSFPHVFSIKAIKK